MFSTINSFFTMWSTSANNSNEPIHLIWISSILREKDIVKLNQWKKLNPNSLVTVWVEPQFIEEVRKQLKESSVVVCNLSTLTIPEKVTVLLKKLTEEHPDLPPNPGAASDVYRFFILHERGGWYVDFDKVPFIVNNHPINPVFQFQVNGYTVKAEGIVVPRTMPDVLAAFPRSPFTKNAMVLLDSVAPYLAEEEHIELIRSRYATVRQMATESTTGKISHFCLYTMMHEGNQFISRDLRLGPKRLIHNMKDFNSVVTKFDWNFENSWVKIPGVILDKNYTDKISFFDPALERFINNFYSITDQVVSKLTIQSEIERSTPDLKKVSDLIAEYALPLQCK